MSSNDYSSIMPHAAPDGTDPTLQSGQIRSMIKRMLKNGLDMPVRFLQSLRVGKGTGLASFDGQDGAIIANGASAKIVMGDQSNPSANAYALWRDNAAIVYLDSSTGNTVAQLNTQSMATVLRKSLRVGNSNGLAAFDSTDGAVAAHGGNAGFFFGSRASATDTSWAGWLYDGTTAAFQTSKYTGNILAANATTAALVAARSIRVGTGVGLSANDGADGIIIASGVSASLLLGDTGNPAANTSLVLALSGFTASLRHSNGTQIGFRSDNGAVGMPKSLRVGSGTAIAAQDGQDGMVAADGPAAGVWIKDRAAADYAGWYMSGGVFFFYHGGTIWAINATTGLITQDALAALTPAANVAVSGSGFLASGTRLLKPTGLIYCSLQCSFNANFAIGAVIATVAAAHKPSLLVPVVFRYSNGTAQTGYIDTGGQIHIDFAVVPSSAANGVVTYYP